VRDTRTYRRAALLVDFDNIHTSLRRLDPSAAHVFASDPLRWATWLEERLGAVGPASSERTPRVLLQKICYLNPSVHGNYRPYFTRAGFRVVDCPSLTSQGKNSADIHMVIDALDLLAHRSEYDEFIILSLDADFSPLFQRLRSYDRRVVMLGSGPSSAALRNTCDYVIPDDVFISEALLGEDLELSDVTAVAAPLMNNLRSDPASSREQLEPLPSAGQPEESGAEDAALRAKVREALTTLLAREAAPLPLARAAQEVTRMLGPVVRDSRWAGCGNFKGLVKVMVDDQLDYRIEGVVGFLYDPSRHDIDAAFAAHPAHRAGTERFTGEWADVASRVVRVLGLPPLTPQEWQRLFSAAADELNGQPFASMSEFEKAVATAAQLARSRVHFVVMGLAMRGYSFVQESGHAAERIAESFLENTLRLAENAQLALDEDDKRGLRQWLTEG